tara:strand:- start:278 stop:490 length:213 start_codon:yes stop_codon:yes gene_type:complete
MEQQLKSYEIVFDSEYQGKIQVGMHIQLAESLEDALKIFIETIPYEEIFEVKYRGLRLLDGKPSKEVNSA